MVWQKKKKSDHFGQYFPWGLFLDRTYELQGSKGVQNYQSKSHGHLGLWIERFSFECRKVIGFAITTLRDRLKRFALLFHPIRSKTKTNRDALACIFPRSASATCNYFEF